ncbi:hypothetical protein E3J49_08720 [Candidatus Bathyarchaeota archaeon]|nr:MAG: hypothetical protein E3J49_08720 [Candidatus Bathyarchaeota archaeon]
MIVKTWKKRPAHHFILELLEKKGSLTDVDLFNALNDEFKDLGIKDFYELLMRLEIGGKIRVTSMARGKKRIELVK